jgi:hypothetical protein
VDRGNGEQEEHSKRLRSLRGVEASGGALFGDEFGRRLRSLRRVGRTDFLFGGKTQGYRVECRG